MGEVDEFHRRYCTCNFYLLWILIWCILHRTLSWEVAEREKLFHIVW